MGSPWLWGRTVDLSVFAGSTLVAVALVALRSTIAPHGKVDLWAFVLLIVAIDVAHVWSTLFRTYLDRDELRARPMLYAGVPLICYAGGVLLYMQSALWFWRLLAYVAAFHFVRQQVGWVAIYRARAGDSSKMGRLCDEAAVYAATCIPLLYWHISLPRHFDWFTDGDFVRLPIAGAQSTLWIVYAASIVAYLVYAIARRDRPNWGKHTVVLSTYLTWAIGIVITNSDFEFTVMNVICHGVPYVVLLYFYSRHRFIPPRTGFAARIVGHGIGLFLLTLVVCAFAEEFLWDQLVWHAHPGLFGQPRIELDELTAALIVPLLALPQATHYVLDAFLWRRRGANASVLEALGFRAAART